LPLMNISMPIKYRIATEAIGYITQKRLTKTTFRYYASTVFNKRTFSVLDFFIQTQ